MDSIIRIGRTDDAKRLSAFVYRISEEYIVGEFTPQGRANFLREHTEDMIRQRLNGDFRFYVAESGESICGIAAVRSNAHLFYLFVGREFQRQGLARRLLEKVVSDSLALGNPGHFTVNASNYAVAAYERLGFRCTAAAQQTDGVLFNPMELVRKSGLPI